MADFGDEIWFATVRELNAKLVAREFSARDLAKAFARRLSDLGPRYNALALALEDRAHDRTGDVDDDFKRQRLRGPLQGVPWGVLDLLSVAGKPTTWGAQPYAGQVFESDAAVVKRLDGVGAPVVGKLATVSLGGAGGYGLPSASMSGACRNPWNPAYWAGGSSSGAAAAVAAGLVPFAIGSEAYDYSSLLTPAAYCGVTALRPTYGYVSRGGAMPLSWTMHKLGPVCRSVEDCGLVLQQISGGDSRDPGSAGKSFYYAPEFARAFKDLRVGYADVDYDGWADAAARPVFQKALDTLVRMGLVLMETRLPEYPYELVAREIVNAENAAAFEPLVESGRVRELSDEAQVAGLEAGLGIAAKDYLKAMRIRRMLQDALRLMMIDYDVLISPVRPGPATRIDQPVALPKPASLPLSRGLTGLNAAGNLAGLPALSLPCGFVNGLPVAIELAGRPFTENTLLAIGLEYQRRTDWHKQRPPA
jgi:aspartyl-tRNA(Asn)/glutamyl-tRNA(Gln) amidotransferase subunit A